MKSGINKKSEDIIDSYLQIYRNQLEKVKENINNYSMSRVKQDAQIIKEDIKKLDIIRKKLYNGSYAMNAMIVLHNLASGTSLSLKLHIKELAVELALLTNTRSFWMNDRKTVYRIVDNQLIKKNR